MSTKSAPPFAVFRVDGSATMGGGHVRRCASLADGLIRAGWRVAFAGLVSPEAIGLSGTVDAFDIQVFDQSADGPRLLRNSWPDGCDLLIVDHYQLDEGFERQCAGWARRMLVIDDLANRRHDCDVLVDQTPGREARDYRAIVNAGCALFMGPDYALLDSRFAAARSRMRRDFGAVRRLLVTFGYADQFGITALALEGVLQSGVRAAVDIVFGLEPPDIARIHGLVSRLSPASQIHFNTRDMVSMIMRADLAIGAGGVSSLERCCLGLPSLLVTLAENQQGNADALAERGAAVALGGLGNVDTALIARTLCELAADREKRETMGKAAALVTDGSGVERVVQYVSNSPALSPGTSDPSMDANR
jgi:UDP-2,4-diacetamido-2,4,6-trideoxy-beta-L-altropyranose hydrolase